MNSQVFREYDIRGIVANDFDDAFVTDLGRGYATLLHRAEKKTVTLGRDCRLSSDRLRDRLAEGLLGAGIDVVDVGVVPTPLSISRCTPGRWTAAYDYRLPQSARVQRLQGRPGQTTFHGGEIQGLRKLIERGDFATRRGSALSDDLIPRLTSSTEVEVQARPRPEAGHRRRQRLGGLSWGRSFSPWASR